MSRKQLEKSLKLWRERDERFHRNWAGYVKAKSKSPRRAYWFARYKTAHAMVKRREKQLLRTPIKTVSSAGVDLIKHFEGFVSHPYQDAVGVWTIGYGHTSSVGPNTKPINQAQASALLTSDLDRTYCPPVAALNLPLTQPQFDALTSLVYNCGPGTIGWTTIGKALRAHDWQRAADAFLLYDHDIHGVIEPGLKTRREAERHLFLS